MDQRQKNLLNSAADQLAGAMNPDELAGILQKAKLVSEEKVGEILAHSDNCFCQNLRLLNALQESDSPTAFDDFIRILEATNVNASKLISSEPQSMLRKFIEKFVKSNQPYPVGMNSSMSNKATASPQTPPTSRPQVATFSTNLSLYDQQGVQQTDNPEHLVAWHPYAQSQTSDQDAHSRTSSPHNCHPSYASSSSGSDTSSDSIFLDQSLITMAIAQEGTRLMAVKKASVIHNNKNKDYKMTSRPRGPCLIVNNIDFEADIFPTRKGSDEDARRFDDIFQQLGFTVIMRRNQTADEMRQLFKDVAAECKEEHDALFVFIFSHGFEHGIYGTDGMEVYLDSEILPCFDNTNCKAMLEKPKVFVIQACRGRSIDFGGCGGDTTDSAAWPPTAAPVVRSASQENQVRIAQQPFRPSSQPKEDRRLPIQTDMMIVFSCLAGFVSVRNETAGSWLGVALAYFIMKHAHEEDLYTILKSVTSDVIRRESSNGHVQSIEVKCIGWRKNLYFNPGIFSDIP